MTADCPEDYPYEAKPELRDPAVREGYWRVAMGLQEVDGLKPSPYLRDLAREHVSGVRGLDETGSMIRAYHARRKADGRDEAAGEREADLVSQRIVELLASGAFALVPDMLAVIHGALFQDLDAATYRPGEYKTEALQKREFVLNGDSVVYADPSLIERSLAFLFDEERSHVYGIEFDEAQLEHLGRFIARLWQVHPFVEGNTRTTAVFAVLYLHDLGFDVDNEPFERHARYFRDALVRANYRNAKAGVLPDLRFVVRFLDNLAERSRTRAALARSCVQGAVRRSRRSSGATSIRRKRSACRETLPFPVAQRLLYEALEVCGEALGDRRLRRRRDPSSARPGGALSSPRGGCACRGRWWPACTRARARRWPGRAVPAPWRPARCPASPRCLRVPAPARWRSRPRRRRCPRAACPPRTRRGARADLRADAPREGPASRRPQRPRATRSCAQRPGFRT